MRLGLLTTTIAILSCARAAPPDAAAEGGAAKPVAATPAKARGGLLLDTVHPRDYCDSNYVFRPVLSANRQGGCTYTI